MFTVKLSKSVEFPYTPLTLRMENSEVSLTQKVSLLNKDDTNFLDLIVKTMLDFKKNW